MSGCVSRRRFLGLTGAGIATVAGAGVLYGIQRIPAGAGGGDREAVTSAAARPAPQTVVVETRYTPAGVPYLAAVALD
ncbi:MAG: hypothetical protein QOG88_1889 [Actinomycetota bacterium]|jgi:hypothetical protein|nr:hypothetical protein [Actinomycetota bacterium]